MYTLRKLISEEIRAGSLLCCLDEFHIGVDLDEDA